MKATLLGLTLVLLLEKGLGKCPEIPVKNIYPCFCFQDTDEIFCRGDEKRIIDQNAIERIFGAIKNSTSRDEKIFNKLTIQQTEITSIDEDTFKSLAFKEINIIYNFKLKRVHPNAFNASKLITKYIQFGGMDLKHGQGHSAIFNIDFLRGFDNLTNLSINSLPIGTLDETLFMPYVNRTVHIALDDLSMECDCTMKWVTKLDIKKRRQFFGVSAPDGPDYYQVTCRIDELIVNIPLRAMSLGDFEHCP